MHTVLVKGAAFRRITHGRVQNLMFSLRNSRRGNSNGFAAKSKPEARLSQLSLSSFPFFRSGRGVHKAWFCQFTGVLHDILSDFSECRVKFSKARE